MRFRRPKIVESLGSRILIAVMWRLSMAIMVGLANAPLHAQDITAAIADSSSPLDRPLGELHHVSYGERDNVPGDIGEVTRDADGFLWVSAGGGLFRFDGVKFDHVFGELGLPNRSLYTTYIGKDGSLWLGYSGGGLAHVSRQGDVSVWQAPDIPYGTVYTILAGPNGEPWVATTHGIARLVQGKWTSVGPGMGYDGHQPEALSYMDGSLRIIDVDGVWDLPRGGVHFQRKDRQQAIDAAWRAVGTPSRLYDVRVDGDAFVDSSGALWVAVAKGLERHRWIPKTDGSKEHVVETYAKEDGLSGNDVRFFFEDREHNVWVLTDNGIDQFHATKFRPLPLKGSIASPSMVVSHDGMLWITTTWEDSVKVSGSDLVPIPFVPRAARATLLDHSGAIWQAGPNGLKTFHDDQAVDVPLPPDLKTAGSRFQALGMGPDGGLWASATGFDLYKLFHGAWEKKDQSPFSGSEVLRMVSDPQGHLWMGRANNTLIEVKPAGTETYDSRQGLGAGSIKAISFGLGTMWVGGDNGLFYRDQGKFLPLKGGSGESFIGLMAVLPSEDGDLWLAGRNGVYKIDASQIKAALASPGKTVDFTQFRGEDGLVSIRMNLRPLPSLVQTRDGRIWYASTSSVSWIDPRHVLVNRVAPFVSIDRLQVGDKAFQTSGQVEIPSTPGRVEFSYAAASYTDAGRVLFRYKLDGVDAGWQTTHDRHVAYTNLMPGSYRFHLSAVNEDGVESNDEAQVAMIVPPAWYQTWVFRLTCVAIALALVTIMYLMRIHQLHARTLASFEARHEERERIARDLHDTLLQDVQGLLMRLHAWSDDETLPAQYRSDLSEVAHQTRRAVIEGRDRISDLRQRHALGLIDTLRSFGEALAPTHGLSFSCRSEGMEPRLSDEEFTQLAAMAVEAMRNACVHSKGSLLRLLVEHSPFSLSLVIEDNGCGIPLEALQGTQGSDHWGIAGMRERAMSIHADLNIRRLTPNGTRVSISLSRLAIRRLWRKR